MTVPQVYRAITAISAELAPGGIAKAHRNERDDYVYRSIDDVLNRLSPLLARHKLCVLPRVQERTCTDRTGEGDELLVSVTLRVAFDLVSAADGSTHTVEAFGEALDSGDKATAKAMSSAYKQAMLQTFCVPVAPMEDVDRSSYRLKRNNHQPEPVEGWEQWSAGIIDIAQSCATLDALQRLQERQRSLLAALKRERPEFYDKIGEAFAKRTSTLDGKGCAGSGCKGVGEGRAKPKAETDGERCAKREGGSRRLSKGRVQRKTSKSKEQASNDTAAVPETA